MIAVELAVEGCTLKVQTPASGGSFVILPIGSGSIGSKMKCQGNQVYTSLAFTVTAVSMGAVVSGSGGGTIAGTATKAKASGQPPVRKGDSVIITVTDANPPYGTASVTVEVNDPGQTKAKAV
jgi:hypothetical protein